MESDVVKVEDFYGVLFNKREFCKELKDYLGVESDYIEILAIDNGFIIFKDRRKSYRVKLSDFLNYLEGGV